MKRGTWGNSLVLIPLLIATASGQDGGGRFSFPEAKPEQVGMDEAKLAEARDYALRGGGSGCVLCGGRLVTTWGDQRVRYDIFSSTKSIGVTALGLAIMDGKVNLHDPVKRYLPGVGVPPESNAQSGWLEELTLWHLATQTGGFEKTRGWCRQLKRPGTTWMYSDGGPNWLADCLTVTYGRDLLDVMNERVFQPLGITVGETPTGGDHDLYWGFNYLDRSQQLNGINRRPFGAGIFCNVTAMARIGYLYLHRGRWEGKQIIPEEFVAAAATTSPGMETLPVADGLDWTAGAPRHYGLLWWNNNDGAMAGVPRDAFWAYGMKESILAVVPSLDLVAVRAGEYLAPSEDPKRADTYNNLLKPFLLPICQSVASGQTNQFYVAVEEKGASDDNDGAHAVYQGGKVGPWRTIQRALQAAQPGDTIFVGRGRYTEEVSITVPRIQLRALGGARPLIDGEDVRPYGIRNPDTVAAQDVLIEGFEIANHTIAGVMIAGRGSRGVTIRGDIVHHARDKGIDVHGTGHRIEGNIVFLIGNNQEAMGIHLSSASDCLVQDNDVFLCKKTAIRDQSGQRNTIQGNLMHQCWTGLDYNACSGTQAFNNYLYDNSQGFNPKHVKGDAGWNLFWHNTVYDSHGPHISIAVNRVDNSDGPGPDCDYLDIRNNILVKAGHTHIWNKPDIVGEHLTIDHNLYFGPPGWPPFFYHTEWPRGDRPGMATLKQVRRETPFEAGGRVADPLLIDSEGGNLAYSDASPAKAGGTNLDSPFAAQLGARGLRKPAARLVPVRLKAIKASVNENLMGYTTDGRYCTGWHSGTETANQWILYEIEGAEAFTHLVLVPVGHKVEFNVRRYEFSVSDDNQTYRRLRAGENNDSGSWFIYEFARPISARYLKFTMLDKFPDDGYTWTLKRLEFDELRAGRLAPLLLQDGQGASE